MAVQVETIEEAVERGKVEMLEELIEWNLKRAAENEHTIDIAGEHYTYRDNVRLFQRAAQDLERFHVGLLRYPVSIKKTRAIRDKVVKYRKALAEDWNRNNANAK